MASATLIAKCEAGDGADGPRSSSVGSISMAVGRRKIFNGSVLQKMTHYERMEAFRDEITEARQQQSSA